MQPPASNVSPALAGCLLQCRWRLSLSYWGVAMSWRYVDAAATQLKLIGNGRTYRMATQPIVTQCLYWMPAGGRDWQWKDGGEFKQDLILHYAAPPLYAAPPPRMPLLQAFALPVLQIAHEALKQKERIAMSAAASSGPQQQQQQQATFKFELSSEDRDAWLSVKDGVRCQSRQERNWGGARASVGATAGKVYYEVGAHPGGWAASALLGGRRWRRRGCLAACISMQRRLLATVSPHSACKLHAVCTDISSSPISTRSRCASPPSRCCAAQATVCDEGLCRVGWSTLAGALDLGTDKHGFGFGGTGKKSHARQFEE